MNDNKRRFVTYLVALYVAVVFTVGATTAYTPTAWWPWWTPVKCILKPSAPGCPDATNR